MRLSALVTTSIVQLALTLSSSVAADAERLPSTVTPDHYDLWLNDVALGAKRVGCGIDLPVHIRTLVT